ncbi:MAG: hypothetical protein LBI06_05160 [Treponema sp.]|jgi:hypothetical protein|nr:hypothetical protein [Treponema sp.]
MKKLFIFSLIIGFALALGACNTGSNGTEGGEPTDVIWTWGEGDSGALLQISDDSNDYPGRELILGDCPNISGPTDGSDYVLGDISYYGEAILLAILYDEDDNEITSGTSLAQFNILLEGSSGWDESVKLLEQSTAYNLADRIAKSATPKSGAEGKPGKLLVQGSYNQADYEPGKVTRVVVQKLTLKLRTDLPSFTVQYGSGITTSGNKITFDNVMYSDAAALYTFPETFSSLDALAGKKLVFNFTLENTAANLEHQIHIQAAGADGAFNGQNPYDHDGVGQFYVTLDDANGQYDQSYNSATLSGIFKISFDELITASNASGDINDLKGPFDLTAVRIVNNGTTWDDAGVSHVRNKSYSVIFNSITVE